MNNKNEWNNVRIPRANIELCFLCVEGGVKVEIILTSYNMKFRNSFKVQVRQISRLYRVFKNITYCMRSVANPHIEAFVAENTPEMFVKAARDIWNVEL